MTLTNFINLRDFSGEQLEFLIDRAITDKALWKAGRLPRTLAGKTLAMILEKPSLRTRVSFETAMTDLDGHAIYLTKADIGLGSREDVKDIARVLGRMCDGIMARTFSHEFVEALGRWACVPVINALTDYSHPCQAMADLMTLKEISGGLSGRKVAFVGDGNNVARSLATACAKLGMRFALACPPATNWTRPPWRRCATSARRARRSRRFTTPAPPSPTPTWSTPTRGCRWARKPKNPAGSTTSRASR